MNRYTTFALLLVSLLAFLVVETINAQGTPVPTTTPASATSQITPTALVTPTSAITTTGNVTATVPNASATQAITGTVINANILNVRSGPDTNSTRISTLLNGASVAIVGRDNLSTWFQVRLPADQIGWVSSQFVRSNYLLANVPVVGTIPGVNTTATPGTGGAATANVNTDILNVRSGPGLTFSPLTTITQGQTVTLLGRNADSAWVQVRLADGRTGWVNSQFVTANLALSTLPVTSS